MPQKNTESRERQSRSQALVDCGGKRSATPLWLHRLSSESGVGASLCHRTPESSRVARIVADCSAKTELLCFEFLLQFVRIAQFAKDACCRKESQRVTARQSRNHRSADILVRFGADSPVGADKNVRAPEESSRRARARTDCSAKSFASSCAFCGQSSLGRGFAAL